MLTLYTLYSIVHTVSPDTVYYRIIKSNHDTVHREKKNYVELFKTLPKSVRKSFLKPPLVHHQRMLIYVLYSSECNSTGEQGNFTGEVEMRKSPLNMIKNPLPRYVNKIRELES